MKRLVLCLLVILCFPIRGISETTIELKQATILGNKVKLGQGADIVQSRIRAKKFVAAGYNYGDLSKGYYVDKGTTYIITYGPPKSNTGGYVVKKIEKVVK